MPIIELKNLTKKFGDLTAVDQVTLDIAEGEVFGFLGPNGAGKTTTIAMLATMLRPTSGEAKLCGYDIATEQHQVRQNIGIVFQDPSLDTELTGRENLNFHGRLYNMDKELRLSRVEEVLKLVELEDKADTIVKKYSGGMKRRLEIARGLMHHPRVLFLDEPTLGLDPQTRHRLWQYIEDLNKREKVTVMLTTHYMEEADYLSDRIGIIDKGKIVAIDTSNNLKKIIGGDVVNFGTDKPKELANIVKRHDGLGEVETTSKSIKFVAHDGDKLVPSIIRDAERQGIDIVSVHSDHPSLDDVFIHYTGRKMRPEEASSKDRMRARWQAHHK